jgi:DNA mismatch repair protein MutL
VVHVSFAGSTGLPESQSHPADIQVEVESSLPSLVSQVGSCYLIAATPSAIYLIDQHAAHERILFEELYDRLETAAQAPGRQRLLFPLLVQLTPAEAALVDVYREALARLGFSCELGAGPSLVVHEVPLSLAGRVTAELVHGVFSELAADRQATQLAARTKALAASLACRAAIKAGDRLPPDECYTLVRQLLSRRSSLSCPHGRPTLIRLSRAELDRMFLR